MADTDPDIKHSSTLFSLAAIFLEEKLKGLHPLVALAMLALGFASGLPLMMLFQKLSFRLSEAGIDRSTIGFLYWVTLAYTLKVFWAPVVDRVKIPIITKQLGQRRSWIMLACFGTAIGLFIIGVSDPATALWLTLIGAFILAYSGATLDIGVDAWRIESAPNRSQAMMAAIYILGYRFAIMFSAFGLIIAGLAENASKAAQETAIQPWYGPLVQKPWALSYGIMAIVMLILGSLVLLAREPEQIAKRELPGSNWFMHGLHAIIQPFYQLFKRLDAWIIPVLLLVAIYRLTDFTMGVMTSPFYREMGYAKEIVGSFQFFTIWLTIIGGFVGGISAIALGLMRSLAIGAVFTFLTTLAFAWLTTQQGQDPNNLKLAFVVGADNLSAGYVGAVFIGYLSALTDRANAATQYALLSSAYALFCKLIAGFSGVMVDAMGWFNFFTFTALFAPISVILIAIISRSNLDAARGIVPTVKNNSAL